VSFGIIFVQKSKHKGHFTMEANITQNLISVVEKQGLEINNLTEIVKNLNIVNQDQTKRLSELEATLMKLLNSQSS